ncbi:MAG: prepilin-type N-terminal cleavage/methylation domain-containing protein [Desulforhopalus sp.]
MKTKILKNDKGFTLIEMAIVLVIIGLILGAVIKGKDVLNSAKQKKFYTTFVKEWELSVASYFDRTGNLLGDGTTNGGSATTKNGRFDNVSGVDFTNINDALKAVGLTEIVSNVTSNGQYTYTGTYSGSATMTMHLYYLYSHREKRSRNALYFTGMPTDLAIAIDTMVDGEADAEKGNWRQYTDSNGATWPNAETTTTVNAAYTINLP